MNQSFFPQRRKDAKLIFVVVIFLCIFAPLRETSS